MLVLFDIDGTLLLTEGAGIAAMRDAGRELFGEHFSVDGVEFSGRIDPLIWRDLAVRHELDAAAHHDAFRAAYGRHLQHRLENGSRALALPGVPAIVAELSRIERITLGLLTGNYEETGRIKLSAAGLSADDFAVRAWGTDGATRRDLPCAALAQYQCITRQSLPGESVIIIGDTPHDVDCARHNGCRAIAVCTGAYDAEQLSCCGADLVVSDLSDTAAVLEWLLKSAVASPE
jgi:phosphoglycolate phosphatase